MHYLDDPKRPLVVGDYVWWTMGGLVESGYRARVTAIYPLPTGPAGEDGKPTDRLYVDLVWYSKHDLGTSRIARQVPRERVISEAAAELIKHIPAGVYPTMPLLRRVSDGVDAPDIRIDPTVATPKKKKRQAASANTGGYAVTDAAHATGAMVAAVQALDVASILAALSPEQRAALVKQAGK